MRSTPMFNACLFTAAAAVAVSLSSPVRAESTVMTDNAGMTVYTFDKDAADRSAFYGECAAAWPPVAAETMPSGSDFAILSRDDGTDQAIYHGKPLYHFAGDRKAGDVNGDNVQNIWHVVRTSKTGAAPQPKPAASLYGGSYGY